MFGAQALLVCDVLETAGQRVRLCERRGLPRPVAQFARQVNLICRAARRQKGQCKQQKKNNNMAWEFGISVSEKILIVFQDLCREKKLLATRTKKRAIANRSTSDLHHQNKHITALNNT